MVEDPKIWETTDAMVRLTSSAIDAYEIFDQRDPGWLKVGLTPGA